MIRRYFQRAPLSTKLVILMMFTSTTSVLLSFAILGFIAWLAPLDQVEASNAASAKLLENLAAANDPGQPSYLSDTGLELLETDPRIIAGYLYDEAGTINSVYHRTPSDAQTLDFHRSELSRAIVSRYEIAGRDSSAIGTLVMLSDVPARYLRQSRFMSALGLSFLAAMIIAFIISRRVQGSISRPIRTLTRITSPIEFAAVTQDPPRIQPDEDELRQIGRNVLQMSAQIEDGKEALASAYNQMEEKIDERTRNLKDEKEAAEKATLIKSQFLANISHELRTPMHGILSFANFGIKKADKADRNKLQDYFFKIQKAGHTLLDLLNDLLDLAKLEAGRTRFEFKSEGILQVIKDVIDEYHALVEEQRLSVRITESVDSMVFMDRKRILQVARNILNNAIKFSPEGTEIQIRVRQIDGAAIIEIRDHGEGVPAEDLDEIFEKFVQAHDERNAGGTGLGLAICKEIIKSHNGDIWVYNHPTGGAVFIFSLPLASAREDVEGRDVDGEPILTRPEKPRPSRKIKPDHAGV